MQGRYAAFTFVDRITTLVPGVSARATFHIPATIRGFPSALLAEATGQLAAWVAVAKLDFRLRPVAGIAHESIYTGAPKPGDTLVTEIRIDSCEDDAVAYQGTARIADDTVCTLRDCVGPMLPLEDFDDADAMRAFFATLTTAGAAIDRFEGVDDLPLDVVEQDVGGRIAATLDVPDTAGFFADHFPRRPVFPGTLLLDRMAALADRVVRELRKPAGSLHRVTDVKLRSFIEPGTRLQLRASVESADAGRVTTRVEALAPGQRRPVGAAHLEFAS
ncbi:MAG TPA: hypothetical protein VNE58_16900 [Casimicrobiaceae bacterium]|nr:hypothetical protein [Casimicrobiaceae bacterium]